MKTSELKKIVEDNGFIFINNDFNRSIFVYKNSEEQMNLRQSGFVSKENEWFGVDDNMPKVIAQAMLDYAYTPLSEREEEKKYMLMFPKEFKNSCCLNYMTDYGVYFAGKCEQVGRFIAHFSQKEIDAMPFDTNFFIKEEVK